MALFIDGFAESVGAADEKDDAFGRHGALLGEKSGEINRAVLLAALVEQDETVALPDVLADKFALLLLLLLNGEALGGLEFRDNFHFKRQIVADAPAVIFNLLSLNS